MEVAQANKLRDLRQRVLNGGEYTHEELRKAIQSITGDRLKELETSATKTARKKAPVKKVDLTDFL